jgi:hypothetical protein
MDTSGIMIRNCVFSFQCKGKWEKMELFEDGINESMAFCSECCREVYLCESDEILLKNIYLNRCVAFYKELLVQHVPQIKVCD